MVFLCISPPPKSHHIQTQFNLGIILKKKNREREREIENEYGVLGFGIEVADCLFDVGEKKSKNKEGTQMTVVMFVILCN
jgi:hypothetical protein